MHTDVSGENQKVVVSKSTVQLRIDQGLNIQSILALLGILLKNLQSLSIVKDLGMTVDQSSARPVSKVSVLRRHL